MFWLSRDASDFKKMWNIEEEKLLKWIFFHEDEWVKVVMVSAVSIIIHVKDQKEIKNLSKIQKMFMTRNKKKIGKYF